ncbi:MAG: polysaccharide biosynthesis/export family protein [Candidatus Sulfotelmatobacter sp.]
MRCSEFSFSIAFSTIALIVVLSLPAAAQQTPGQAGQGTMPAGQSGATASVSSVPTSTGAAQQNLPRPGNVATKDYNPGSTGTGSTAVGPTVTGSTATDGFDSSLLKLGAGDLLEVNVYNVPELNTKARVGNSGDIYLPLIDYVHVGDLTVEEAQSLIEKRLGDGGFVRNPHVTLFVDESASQGVTILGEVSRPGIYPDVGDHKLYEIISLAGGFTPSAARKVSIARRNQPQTTNVELPRNLADDLSKDVDIQPGDTILIPRAPIIYVVGDVGRPSGLLVDNGTLTVLQAIALAGGTNKTAKMGGVRIIHKNPTGLTEQTVPLKKMLEAKAPDITLQADDILFVPVSGAKAIAGQTFGAALSLATAVSIYAVHP